MRAFLFVMLALVTPPCVPAQVVEPILPLPAGLSLVASPGDIQSGGETNTLDLLFLQPGKDGTLLDRPRQAYLWKHNPRSQQWDFASLSPEQKGWMPNLILAPGEAAFLFLAEPYVWRPQVRPRGLPEVVHLEPLEPGRTYFLGRQTRPTRDLGADSGITLMEGDVLYRWRGSNYEPFFFALLGEEGWNPSDPGIAWGEGFAFSRGGSTDPGPVPSLVRSVAIFPQDPVVNEGESVRFVARIDFEGPPEVLSIQWFRNDQPIPGAVAREYETPALTLDQSGDRFHATVASVFGSLDSPPSSVRVVPSFSIERGPEDLTVVAGGAARFCVTVLNPAGLVLAYQWFHENQAIPGAEQECLDLPATQGRDAGVYHVVVSDPVTARSLPSPPATLRLVLPLQITRQSRSIMVVEGSPAQLFVDAVGQLPIRYQWFHNQQRVPGETNRAIRFRPAVMTDAGDYHVEVSNPDSSIRSEPMRLEVHPKVNNVQPGVFPGYEPGTVVVKLNPQDGSRVREALLKGVEFAQLPFPGDLSQLNAHYQASAARLAHPSIQESAQGLENIILLTINRLLDPDESAKAYARLASVAFAEPNPEVRGSVIPNDPMYGLLWGMQTIRANLAWNTVNGAGVVVAVIDSGVDLAHCDVAPNLWQNPGETGLDGMGQDKTTNGVDDDGNGYVDDRVGWDFVEGDGVPQDGAGHGTHVAGTVAAVGNNNEGVIGLAYGARLMILRGLDNGNAGTLAPLLQAITYAADNGADIINNSWGGSFSTVWGDAVVDYAHSKGLLVVSAAGNEAAQTCLVFPANAENSMAVGAVELFDVLSYYSNYGVKTDVVAPGGDNFGAPSDILSALSAGSLFGTGGGGVPGVCASNLWLAGTSMAAPHVAGLAALIWQANPGWSAEEVKQRLRQAVLPLGVAGVNGFDSSLGYGRIDAPTAVAPGSPPPIASITSPKNCEMLLAGVGAPAVHVMGQAGGGAFSAYVIQIAPGIDPGPGTFTPLGGGNIPVTGGVLHNNLQLAALPNGTYTLRVVTTDTGGRMSEDRNEIRFRSAYISSPAPGDLIRVPVLSVHGGVPGVLQQPTPGGLVPDPLSEYTLSWRTHGGSPTVFHTSSTPPGLVLGPWDTSSLPEGDIFVELRATYQSGTVLTDEVRVVLDRLLRSGFPAAINESFTAKSPLVADLDRDGKKEIIYGASVFQSDGTVRIGWDANPGLGRSNPAVVDAVGNDGRLEVIAAVMSTYASHQPQSPNCGGPVVHCFPHQGKTTPLWSFIPQNPLGTSLCDNIGVPSTVSAGDVDGDGLLEVVFTVCYMLQAPTHTTLFILDAATGALRAQRDLPGLSVSSVALANLDAAGDPPLEMVLSRSSGIAGGSTYVLRLSGGVVLDMAGWPRPGGNDTSDPVVGDVDADGKYEILVGDRLWLADGTSYPGWPFPSTMTAGGALVPMCDPDCRLEVVLGTRNSEAIRVVQDDRTLLQQVPLGGEDAASFTIFENGSQSVPIVADVTGDGCAEVLRGSPGGFSDGRYSRLYATTTHQFPRFVLAPTYTVRSSPAVEDLDNDGLTDVVIASAGRLYAWNLGTVHCPRNPWPMFQGDLAHTGTLPLTAGTAKDLFVEDTPFNWNGPPDSGLEPDAAMAAPHMWCSRSLWVRTTYSPPAGNNFRRHENPEFGQQNCVFVKVCSRGCLPVTNALVEVYYARASAGLCWPGNWALAGVASVTNVPAHGFNIVGVPWFPPSSGHFCLLARIVSPDDPISFPNPICIDDYVRLNNNVAWRNVNTIDLLQTTTASFEFRVHNIALTPKIATIRLTADGNYFANGGQADLDLRSLHHRWITNGAQGTQIQLLGGTSVKLVESPAEMAGIHLGADEERVVQITLTVPQPMPRAGLAGIFNLEVLQLVDAAVVGGVAYEVSVRGEDTDTDGDGIPDVSDPDDDNDGIPDGSDPNPLVSDLPVPNLACATGHPYILRAGLRDTAALPSDPSFRGYCLNTAYPGATWKSFDDLRAGAVFGLTFLGLPPDIARGELSFGARPLKSLSEGNSIGLGLIPPCATPALAWSSLLSGLAESGGAWESNPLTTFALNLRELPPVANYATNLLGKLNADHALDLYVQRETLMDWLEVRLWTCPAATFAHGIPHRALGGASLAEGGSGELVIGQIGASGGDGAYAHLGQAEGWVLSTGMLDPGTMNTGAYVQCMSAGSAGGDGNRLLGSARVEDLGATLGVKFDFGTLEATRYTLQVLSNGVVLTTLTNRTGLAGSIPVSTIAAFYDSGSVAGLLPQAGGFSMGVRLPSPGTWTLPGEGDYQADELRAWPEMGGDSLLIDYRQGVFVTGAGVSPVEITTLEPVIMGRRVLASGKAMLHPGGRFLLLSNVDTNGADGVRIRLREAQGSSSVGLAELRDTREKETWLTHTGTWLRVRSVGEILAGVSQPLTEVLTTLVDGASVRPYEIRFSGAGMGATSARIVVRSNRLEVASTVLPAGNIQIRSSTPPRRAGHQGGVEWVTTDHSPGTQFELGALLVAGDSVAVEWIGGMTVLARREIELGASGLPEWVVSDFCERTGAGCDPTPLGAALNAEGGVVLFWEGCGFRLQANDDLDAGGGWLDLSGSSPVVLPPGGPWRWFRLLGCEPP